jgi:hypothetical protein
MTIALGEKQIGKRDTLPRRPQPGITHAFFHRHHLLSFERMHLSVLSLASSDRRPIPEQIILDPL